MVFSDIVTRQGLIQECERITGLGATGISSNTNLLQDFTARLNNAMDRFFALAFEFDTHWNFDDRNKTDLPIATTNLVSGQQDYQFAVELLAVTQVFAKDVNGVFSELIEQDDKLEPNTLTLISGNGTPNSYDLVGNSVLVDPKPNYNSTAGLKVVFKRNGVKFVYTDGSITPGIPSLFHPFLAHDACQAWLQDKNRANKNDNFRDILRDEAVIRTFIANRAKPKRLGLRTVQESNK